VGRCEDIGIIFPLWSTVGMALVIGLAATTVIMARLGVAAYRAHRSARDNRHAGEMRPLMS